MAEERVRVEVAFQGGQTIGGTVSSSAVDALRETLGSQPDGVFELATDDGTYLIPLRAVMYVKRFVKESHIGFGRTA